MYYFNAPEEITPISILNRAIAIEDTGVVSSVIFLEI